MVDKRTGDNKRIPFCQGLALSYQHTDCFSENRERALKLPSPCVCSFSRGTGSGCGGVGVSARLTGLGHMKQLWVSPWLQTLLELWGP